MDFHNELNYDYHFTIKKIAKAFEEEFNCLGENTEKHKTFLVPITKEIKAIDKNWEEIVKTISYKLQFIGSARGAASLLSNFVGTLAERVHKIKCKYRHNNKKWGKCGIKYTDCEYCLEHTIVKDDLIEYKCLCCKKNYQTRFKGN